MGWKRARLDAAWPAGWYCNGPKANGYCLEEVRGDSSPWASQVSACLVREALTPSTPSCLFKDVCIPLGRESVSLRNEGKLASIQKIRGLPRPSQNKEQACLLPVMKGLGSLNSGFLPCNAAHCAYRYLSSDSRCIIWLILWLLVLLWAISYPLSLTPETLVFYQHPRNCGRFDCPLTTGEQTQALYSPWHRDIIVMAGMETKEWMCKKFKLFWPWGKILNLE